MAGLKFSTRRTSDFSRSGAEEAWSIRAGEALLSHNIRDASILRALTKYCNTEGSFRSSVTSQGTIQTQACFSLTRMQVPHPSCRTSARKLCSLEFIMLPQFSLGLFKRSFVPLKDYSIYRVSWEVCFRAWSSFFVRSCHS